MQEHKKVLLIEKGKDGFMTLTLNRPDRLNALNPELLFMLKGAIDEANRTDGLKGVILKGAGGNFCAGGDIFVMKEAIDSQDIHALSPFLSILEETAASLYACRLPMLCLLDGIAAGAGIGLALAADIRIATEETRCHFAFPALGAIPDAGSSYLFPRVIGYQRAMEFYISNEPIDARKGLDWGLFQEVVPREALQERLHVWKEKIASLSLGGFQLSKKLFQQSLHQTMEEQVRAEYFAQLTAMSSEHFARKVSELTVKKDKTKG